MTGLETVSEVVIGAVEATPGPGVGVEVDPEEKGEDKSGEGSAGAFSLARIFTLLPRSISISFRLSSSTWPRQNSWRCARGRGDAMVGPEQGVR